MMTKPLSTKFWLNTETSETQKTKPRSNLFSHWEHWDSKQEYFVYQKLLPIAKKHRLSIVRQYPITIHNSPSFGKIKWTCDFMLFWGVTPIIPIEVKDDWVIKKANALGSFKYQMALLETSKPILFESLILVGSDALRKRLPGFRVFQTDVQIDDFLSEQLVAQVNKNNFCNK